MKKIKTLKDIEKLTKETNLAQPLIEYLLPYFNQLHQLLEPDTKITNFSLEEHGYIVILESDDDVRNLKEVGLNPCDKGLLGTCPEWVEIKELSDGSFIYQIAILYDNDYIMIFYIYPQTFDEEVENWLKEQL